MYYPIAKDVSSDLQECMYCPIVKDVTSDLHSCQQFLYYPIAKGISSYLLINRSHYSVHTDIYKANPFAADG